MMVVNSNANNPYRLTDPESTKKHVDEMKMKIALGGTRGNQDVLNLAIFILVCSKMYGAKMQNTLSEDNKEVLMGCLDVTANWACFQRELTSSTTPRTVRAWDLSAVPRRY